MILNLFSFKVAEICNNHNTVLTCALKGALHMKLAPSFQTSKKLLQLYFYTQIYFLCSPAHKKIFYKNFFRSMFVIENKLSLLYRRVKSMHYPESPKVTSHTPPSAHCPNSNSTPDQSWPKTNQYGLIFAIKICSRGFQKGATICPCSLIKARPTLYKTWNEVRQQVQILKGTFSMLPIHV